MLTDLRNWMRGLRLLRYPELIAWLGREQSRLMQLQSIAAQGTNIKLSEYAHLIGWSDNLLRLSDGVSIGQGTVLAFGDELNGHGAIDIGRNTWIGEYNNLRSGGGDIRIGRDCLISQFVSIIASGHGLSRKESIMVQVPPSTKRGVVIGDDVWIGAGATILPGVTVSSGAVVGAGSVVTRDVEQFSIVVGVPATVIGTRS